MNAKLCERIRSRPDLDVATQERNLSAGGMWRQSSLRYDVKLVHVNEKTEARSRNHCCRGKAGNITYSECVSVALVIQHAMHMRLYYIDLCGRLSGCNIFVHIIS